MRHQSKGGNGITITWIMVIMTLYISASFIMADPCPAGWRGIAPDCVSLASLVTGRGPCSAAISDDFTTVHMSCPCLGDPRDAANGISLSMSASPPSNAATTLMMVPATTTLQGTTVAAGGTGQWAQIDVTMPLADFRDGCDYSSPSDSVDVYRTTVSLKLIQTSSNGNVDTLLTVRYRVMMTVNRLVKASSGVYVAQTIDGEDITAVAKSLVGIASWCSNSPVPSACTYKSNVFQAGQIATMQFGLVSSTLPTFIQSGRCLDFAGNQVWSISSGWSRYANGAGAASVSFAVPSMPNCVTFQWVATVPALTASGDFTMQSVTASIAAPRIVQPMSWYSTKTGMMIQAETPTVATNLSFVFSAEEYDASSSTGSSDDSGSSDSSDAIARSTVTVALFSASFFVILSVFKGFF